MSARTAWTVLIGITVVGAVLAIVGFVMVAQADSYNWLGSGLMQLGISLAIVPLGTVLIRRGLAKRGQRPG